MTIEKNQVVAVHYTLNALEENGEKSFIEKTDADNPFTFLYGVGMMLPKFEEELQGMSAGEQKSFTITAEEGYGEKQDDATVQLPVEMFEQSGMPPVGAILPLQDPEVNIALFATSRKKGPVLDTEVVLGGYLAVTAGSALFNRPNAGNEVLYLSNEVAGTVDLSSTMADLRVLRAGCGHRWVTRGCSIVTYCHFEVLQSTQGRSSHSCSASSGTSSQY